jgi:hypothetical protein
MSPIANESRKFYFLLLSSAIHCFITVCCFLGKLGIIGAKVFYLREYGFFRSLRIN